MGKVVDVFGTMMYGKNPINWQGTVSDEENFVVSAIIRTSVGQEKVKESGVKTQMIARVDITISLWDKVNQKQGITIIPFIAGRILKVTRTDGTQNLFFAIDDNDSQRAFPNLILNDEIHNAIGKETTRVMDLFNKNTKEGKPLVTMNYTTTSTALEFIENAVKVNNEKKAKQATSNKVESSDKNTEEANIAQNILESDA